MDALADPACGLHWGMATVDLRLPLEGQVGGLLCGSRWCRCCRHEAPSTRKDRGDCNTLLAFLLC